MNSVEKKHACRNDWKCMNRIQYTQDIYVCLTVKLRGVAEKGGTNESTRDNFARNRIKHKTF